MRCFVKILISIILVLSFLSCESTKTKEVISKPNPEESLIKVNKYLVSSENEEINNFVKRRNWEMQRTGTGLRYQIYEKGNGDLAKKGQIIRLEYELRLINGDLVYSSDNDGIKEFVIGHGGVESGLEEAVLLLRKGDKVRIILPSHLAYGLIGDQKRIPSRSSLIYNISVINIK
jgi:FKBP-type peptidyl-prolyl cis-trans isomerase